MLAAGGGTDFLARLTGEFVSRALGQQIVVENRTGAGGTIGIEIVAKSPADGYTVLFSNDNIASAPQILKVNGDYQKDLVPVIFIARQPLVWAVHASLKINTLQGIRRRDEEEPAARATRPRASARTSTSWANGSSRRRASSSTTCRIAAPARR